MNSSQKILLQAEPGMLMRFDRGTFAPWSFCNDSRFDDIYENFGTKRKFDLIWCIKIRHFYKNTWLVTIF